jgi:hypothetical protein
MPDECSLWVTRTDARSTRKLSGVLRGGGRVFTDAPDPLRPREDATALVLVATARQQACAYLYTHNGVTMISAVPLVAARARRHPAIPRRTAPRIRTARRARQPRRLRLQICFGELPFVDAAGPDCNRGGDRDGANLWQSSRIGPDGSFSRRRTEADRRGIAVGQGRWSEADRPARRYMCRGRPWPPSRSPTSPARPRRAAPSAAGCRSATQASSDHGSATGALTTGSLTCPFARAGASRPAEPPPDSFADRPTRSQPWRASLRRSRAWSSSPRSSSTSRASSASRPPRRDSCDRTRARRAD